MVKPSEFTAFSTLDPLVKMSLTRVEEEKKAPLLFSRATRMLQGEPSDDDDDEVLDGDGTVHSEAQQGDNVSTAGTVELLSNAAATLREGAVPVREFPNNLTSEPASLAQSTNSSVGEDERESLRKSSSSVSIVTASHQEELRCVLAIVRHGDRTPKQKLKVVMNEPHILKYFHDHSSDCRKDLKVKSKVPMTEFLQTVKETLVGLEDSECSVRQQLMHIRDILERWKIVGLNRKLQLKPRKFADILNEDGKMVRRCSEIQLILKWGGNLTKLGEKQAINLGRRFRHDMYPVSFHFAFD